MVEDINLIGSNGQLNEKCIKYTTVKYKMARVLRYQKRRMAAKKITSFLKRRLAARKLKVRRRNVGVMTRGYLKLVRKTQEFWLQNTSVSNVPRLAWIAGGLETAYTGTIMTLGTVTSGMNGAQDIPFQMKFALSDLINFTDITSLCDNYRIKGVFVRIHPSFTDVNLGSLYSHPQLNWIVDKDDAAVPTVDSIRQKMGVKTRTFKPGQYVGMYLPYPNFQVQVQDSTGTTTGLPLGNKYLDVSDLNIPHFGIKGYFGNVDLPASGIAKIAFKFDIAMVIEAKNFQ